MSIGKLDHYSIRTLDIEASRRFYTEVMGFQVGFRPLFKFPGLWLSQTARPIRNPTRRRPHHRHRPERPAGPQGISRRPRTRHAERHRHGGPPGVQRHRSGRYARPAAAPQRGFSRTHRTRARPAPGVFRGPQRRHHRVITPPPRHSARHNGGFVDAVHRPRAARPRHRRLARRPLHRQPAVAPRLGRRGIRAVRRGAGRTRRRHHHPSAAIRDAHAHRHRDRRVVRRRDPVPRHVRPRRRCDRNFTAAAESHDPGPARRTAESGIPRRALPLRLFLPTPGAGCGRRDRIFRQLATKRAAIC